MCPKTISQHKTKPSCIKKVSMLVDDLCHFQNCQDPLYSQYIELMRFTNTDKLSMLTIRCSKRSVAMIDNYQEIWLWGDGLTIGAGRTLDFMSVPFSIGKFLGKSYLAVALGHDHSVAIDSKHKLYVWGSPQYCCHGSLSAAIVWKPKKLGKATFSCGKIYAQHIGASDNFTLVSIENKLFAMGKECHGRLGLDQANIDYTDIPYLVPLHVPKVCGLAVG